MSGVQLGLAGLAVSENGLRTEMEQSRGIVSEASVNLTAALGNAIALKGQWEEAMLQMTSLIDEVSRRTANFDKSAAELTSVAVVVGGRLSEIEVALNAVGIKLADLNGSTAEVASGNKAIVSAFADLQSASQKLKHLGIAITGHFNIWQDQTRKVYGKSQESTENIEASFIRIGKVVTGMEGILTNLSAGLAREEASRTRAPESRGEAPFTPESTRVVPTGLLVSSPSSVGPSDGELMREQVI
jgi:hypothetical protein